MKQWWDRVKATLYSMTHPKTFLWFLLYFSREWQQRAGDIIQSILYEYCEKEGIPIHYVSLSKLNKMYNEISNTRQSPDRCITGMYQRQIDDNGITLDKWIYIGTHLINRDKAEEAFILAHEVGHHVWHYYTNEYTKHLIKQEDFCDQYLIKLMGDYEVPAWCWVAMYIDIVVYVYGNNKEFNQFRNYLQYLYQIGITRYDIKKSWAKAIKNKKEMGNVV